MRHIITAFCDAGCQTRTWLGPALYGVNAEDQETFRLVMDETLGVAPSDVRLVVQLLAPELQRYAHGLSEADLCVKLIGETALHELNMDIAYSFVADVCRRDSSDLLRSCVLSQLPEERATAVNQKIAELTGGRPLPLPRREPDLFSALKFGALKAAVVAASAA